jgi:hypothetical protein
MGRTYFPDSGEFQSSMCIEPVGNLTTVGPRNINKGASTANSSIRKTPWRTIALAQRQKEYGEPRNLSSPACLQLQTLVGFREFLESLGLPVLAIQPPSNAGCHFATAVEFLAVVKYVDYWPQELEEILLNKTVFIHFGI